MINKTVSSLIKPGDIEKWNCGDVITIKAGTGKGKSYFIKNRLYASAKKENKKILMLVHRINCKDQFQLEIENDNKTDIIEIKTYQSIEVIEKQGESFDFSPYKYIISDEFHYFMGDAGFNMTTDISLNAILEQTDKIRIFMSATGNYMSRYIENVKEVKVITYEMDIDYNFIDELTFFYKDESMEQFIDECIEKDIKAMFFIRSAKKAYELHKKYEKHSLFNCSKSNSLYKYVDEKKITSMLLNERFEERILITTTTMDAGVNIIDEEVTHIVCDVEDIGSMIQCTGRKRLTKEDDKISLHIKNVSNNQLGNRIANIKQETKMADYRREEGNDKYIEKYGRDYTNIVYLRNGGEGVETVVNELAYFKRKIDMVDMFMMINRGKYGYMNELVDLFKIEDYRIIEEEYEKEKLEDYLDRIVGTRLYKEEQQELSNLIISELVTISKDVDYRTKKLKPSTLEIMLREQLELSYAVSKSKREDKTINGKRITRSYVIISKIE